VNESLNDKIKNLEKKVLRMQTNVRSTRSIKKKDTESDFKEQEEFQEYSDEKEGCSNEDDSVIDKVYDLRPDFEAKI